MKSLTLLFFIQLSVFTCLAQAPYTCTPVDPSLGRNAKEKFRIETTQWKNELYRSSYYDLQTGKLLHEFIRNDFASFLYTRYTEQGEATTRGYINLSTNPRASFMIQMPDFQRDPTGELRITKDTVIYDDQCYEKHGEWIEFYRTDSICIGSYYRGKKVGEWKIGYQVKPHNVAEEYLMSKNDYFRCVRKVWYEDGVLVSEKKCHDG